MPKRRKVYGADELSEAEKAWLTGDRSRIDPKNWDDFMLEELEAGRPSYHKGRPLWPSELLAEYGHMADAERRRFLELQAKREEQYRPKPKPKAEVVELKR